MQGNIRDYIFLLSVYNKEADSAAFTQVKLSQPFIARGKTFRSLRRFYFFLKRARARLSFYMGFFFLV
jgi:hypothetical protein